MAHVDNIVYSKGANDTNSGNTDMLNMLAIEFKSDFKCFSVKIENCAGKKNLLYVHEFPPAMLQVQRRARCLYQKIR